MTQSSITAPDAYQDERLQPDELTPYKAFTAALAVCRACTASSGSLVLVPRTKVGLDEHDATHAGSTPADG